MVNKELSLAELKLMLTQANDCVMRKDCRIKWLEEKIVELTNDEEIINKVYLKNEEQFSEGIERNCDGFSQTRVKELEDELKSCTLRNSALVRENDEKNLSAFSFRFLHSLMMIIVCKNTRRPLCLVQGDAVYNKPKQ